MGIPIISDFIEGTIGKVVDKALSYIPDPVQRAAADKDIRDGIRQVVLAQIEVNKMEIGTGKLIGMWRAGLGWMLVFSMGYQLILFPFTVQIILIFDDTFPVDKLPKLDWKQLGGILMGMLGLGG